MRFLLLSLLLVAQVASAQLTLPVTFEQDPALYALTDFEGLTGTTIVVDPTNPNNKVARTTKGPTAGTSGGTTVGGSAGFAIRLPFSPGSAKMTVRVWSPDANTPVRLKVEDSRDPRISVETETRTTVAGAWETLTFNFENQATGTEAINFAARYNKASIFFNFGTSGAAAGTKTYYWDDMAIEGGGGGTSDLPSFPISFEETTIGWDELFTGFGGGVLTRVANPAPSGINTSAFVARMVKGAGDPWGGAFFPMASRIDLNVSTEFRVKVWSPRAGARLLFKVENADNGAIAFEQDRTISVANQWTELTYDFSAASRSANFGKIVLIFDLGTVGDGSGNFTFYVDDIAQGATPPPPPPPRPILPISFEETNIDWTTLFTGFDGGELTHIPNPDRSGINTSANVVRMVKGAGQPWGGGFFSLGQPVNLNTSREFRVKVWSPRAGATLLFKLENEANSAIAFEQERTITVANQWTELTYDFTAANAAETYGKVVLIFDLGTPGDGSANFTFYVDDIAQGAAAPPPPSGLPTLPITFEEADIEWATLVTAFDGGELTRVRNPDRFGSNTSQWAARLVKNAGQPWGGVLIPMQDPIDLTKSTEFRLKVWSPRVGARLLFKIENPENGAIAFEQERTIGVANDWTSLTFDMSGANRTALFQNIVLIFDLGTEGDGSANFTFYVDDIEQTATPPPPVNAVVFPVNFESEEIAWSSFFTNFDGGMASRIANPDPSGINTSAFVGRMVKGAGAVWAGSYFRMTSPIDMANPIFRVQVWSPRANARLLFKIENDIDASQAFEVDQTVGVANTWTEMSFNMSGANPAFTYQKIVLIFDLGTAGDGSANYTFFFDNITNRTVTSTEADLMASALVLEPNHPNPFRGQTQISWSVPTATDVRLAVYDLLGREVTVLQDGMVPAGSHTSMFDASTLAPGMYVYRLSAGGASRTGRMTLLP